MQYIYIEYMHHINLHGECLLFFIFMLPDLDVNKDHMCTWRRTNDSTNHSPPLSIVSQSPPSDHVMESTHTTPGAAAAAATSHNIQPPPPPSHGASVTSPYPKGPTASTTTSPPLPVMSRPVLREVLRISPLLRILLTR